MLLGNWQLYQRTRKQLGANGCTKSNTMQMDLCVDTKQDQLPKVMPKLMAQTTYSLVAKMTTLRAIIAVTEAKGWSLHQMDVKNVFVHGDLQEKVYME